MVYLCSGLKEEGGEEEGGGTYPRVFLDINKGYVV